MVAHVVLITRRIASITNANVGEMSGLAAPAAVGVHGPRAILPLSLLGAGGL